MRLRMAAPSEMTSALPLCTYLCDTTHSRAFMCVSCTLVLPMCTRLSETIHSVSQRIYLIMSHKSLFVWHDYCTAVVQVNVWHDSVWLFSRMYTYPWFEHVCRSICIYINASHTKTSIFSSNHTQYQSEMALCSSGFVINPLPITSACSITVSRDSFIWSLWRDLFPNPRHMTTMTRHYAKKSQKKQCGQNPQHQPYISL